MILMSITFLVFPCQGWPCAITEIFVPFHGMAGIDVGIGEWVDGGSKFISPTDGMLAMTVFGWMLCIYKYC